MQWLSFKIGNQILNQKRTTRKEFITLNIMPQLQFTNLCIYIYFLYSRISPNLKAIIYCTAISYGSEEEWDFAWKMYKMTTVASEKDLLLDALGCSRETWILAR